MESKIIRLTLGDWMLNASIAGLVNIIGRDKVKFYGDSVEFSSKELENFEEKYFDYFIRIYEKTLSWHKIVSYKEIIESYENQEFENFDLKSLKSFNYYLKNIVKRYLTSNSYKAAFDLIGEKEEIITLEKNLKKIKEPKSDNDFEKNKQELICLVKDQCELLKQVINYCGSKEGRKYIGAKNVTYNIIDKAWSGISFLNSQTKQPEMYINYKEYFLESAFEYLVADKEKYKFDCFICNEPMKDMENDMSFLLKTGFDVSRKSSHVWNFTNDIAMCPLCKLIYTCLPAGMTYIGDSGIYVDITRNVEENVIVNSRLKREVLYDAEQRHNKSLYWSLFQSLQKESNKTTKYEIADIQVVKYENESYRFNILSASTLNVIYGCRENLNNLIKTNYRDGNNSFNIYELVVERIINNQNLYTLMHKLLHHYVSDSTKCFFHMGHLMDMIIINIKVISKIEGRNYMEDNKKMHERARMAGVSLRTKYKSTNSADKISGVCYRMLNSLKTKNRGMFSDMIINCYLYTKTEMPKVVIDIFENDDCFETFGYSFVIGLLGQDYKEKNEINSSIEEE